MIGKIAIEWTDRNGLHHLKILSDSAAHRYINYLESQGIKAAYSAA